MGCCCSTEPETLSQDGEANERTRLLNDPVSSTYQVTASPSDYGNHYSSSATKKSDEQTALNRILQQTASNIIDVGALEYHTLEQHEYIERVRTYNQRLNTVPPQKIPNRAHHEAQLLCDVSAAERILSAQPISFADFNLMMSSAQKVVAALSHIKVDHKEDLVVPFGIP
ncbi:ragulator complex protein LAMTOR1-like [Homarus americanus]|uniref:Ragulator complex protein LAMTOR1 n=1 Tax=Homarus americanus TaxID=6706 RepID=A0A8J5JV16_HOMAM|nr:ragulator complex protein LAMTOR1-like [Homarus americanus]KAG7164867.1 Ragulator complex protein LAMTOR1-like [Homarus americanus]